MILILGDNIFERVSVPKGAFDDENAYIFIKDVEDPERFGVAEMEEDRVINVEEKPSRPKTAHAATGLYIYPNDVFEIVKKISPSARGELEITDVINYYIKRGNMKALVVEGYWFDTGTLDSLLRASY